MKKTLLIASLSILFNLPNALAEQVQIQGADNLCPHCSGHYLQYKNRLTYNKEKIAGSVNSLIIKTNRENSFVGENGKVIKLIEDLMTRVSENSKLGPAGKKVSSIAFSDLTKKESQYSFFYQVSDSPSERNLWDEVAHSPYQVFATSGLAYDKFIMSFNVMSNYLNALLSWGHEIYHLLDPLVIDFYEDKSYSPLEIFILEYRASLIERDLYLPVKEAHNDHFGHAGINTPAYEKLAKNDPLDLETIQFVLNRIYPTQENKLPRYLPLQQNSKSKDDVILDEHKSNQQIFHAIESQSLIEFSNHYGLTKNDSAWTILKELETFKASYKIITQLLKDYGIKPDDKKLAQQLHDLSNKLSSQIYFPTEKSSKIIHYAAADELVNLRNFLEEVGFYDPNKDIVQNYYNFQSHLKETYLANNTAKRKEILKDLNKLSPKLFSSLSKKFFTKNKEANAKPLQNSSDSYLAYLLKGFIKEYNYHVLDFLEKLNKDSKYIGPKGANGGD